MPGRRLFQYINEKGEKCSLSASHVNEYIRIHTGASFSAKDFRTWMGTVTAFEFLSGQTEYKTKREFNKTVNTCLDAVAAHLGNTRTVCRKYYVHPAVFLAYEKGKIRRILNKEVVHEKYLSDTELHVKSLLAHPS
jgi:DNA topoisomerase-1